MLNKNFTNTKCLIHQIIMPSLKLLLLNHQPSIKLLLNNISQVIFLFIWMLQQNFTYTKCLIQQIPLPSLKLLLLKHQPSIKLLFNKTPTASLLLIHLNVATKIYFLRMVYPSNNFAIPKTAFTQSPAIHKIALE